MKKFIKNGLAAIAFTSLLAMLIAIALIWYDILVGISDDPDTGIFTMVILVFLAFGATVYLFDFIKPQNNKNE